MFRILEAPVLRAYNIIAFCRRQRISSLKAKAKFIAQEIDASYGSKEYHRKGETVSRNNELRSKSTFAKGETST